MNGEIYLPAFRPMRPELLRLNRRRLARRRRTRVLAWFRGLWPLRIPRTGGDLLP